MILRTSTLHILDIVDKYYTLENSIILIIFIILIFTSRFRHSQLAVLYFIIRLFNITIQYTFIMTMYKYVCGI